MLFPKSWFRSVHGVNSLEKLATLFTAITALFMAQFYDSANCASTSNLQMISVKNATTALQLSPEITPKFDHERKSRFNLSTTNDKEPKPSSSVEVSTVRVPQKKLQKTKVVKRKYNRQGFIRTNATPAPRLNFHASQLLSVGVEPTSSFQNGNENVENLLLKYGYRHIPMSNPNNKYQFHPWEYTTQRKNNLDMNSFNIMDLNREAEYNAEALHFEKSANIFPMMERNSTTTTEKTLVVPTKYKLVTTKRRKSNARSVANSADFNKSTSTSTKPSSKSAKSAKSNNAHSNKSERSPPSPPAVQNQTVTRVRYFYAQPPPNFEKQPELETDQVQKLHSPDNNKHPLYNNTSSSLQSPSPSEIAGLVILQLHSSENGKLSQEMPKQQEIHIQAEPTSHNSNVKLPLLHSNHLHNHHQPHQDNIQHHYNYHPGFVSHNRPNYADSLLNSYRSHSHVHDHHHPEHDEEKENMEFQEGRITISKVFLGSKSLKKGTGIVILAILVVTIIIAGLTGVTGASLNPILFPLILLPIAILAFILFIPAILLFVPIVVAGLAGGQERRSDTDQMWDQVFDKMEENMDRLLARIPIHANN